MCFKESLSEADVERFWRLLGVCPINDCLSAGELDGKRATWGQRLRWTCRQRLTVFETLGIRRELQV